MQAARRYLRLVERPETKTIVRLALVAFVLVWLFGPYELRSAVPIWLPFLIALGLELQFVVGALRAPPARRPDRRPQAVDVERYGYAEDADELLLVREGGEELWIPYSGEPEEEVATLIAEERERRDEEASAPVSPPPSAVGRLSAAFCPLSGSSRAGPGPLGRRGPHGLERARRAHPYGDHGAPVAGGLARRREAGHGSAATTPASSSARSSTPTAWPWSEATWPT